MSDPSSGRPVSIERPTAQNRDSCCAVGPHRAGIRQPPSRPRAQLRLRTRCHGALMPTRIYVDRDAPCDRNPAMLTPMSDFFDYVRHPHVNQRKEAGPPKVADAAIAVHGPGPIGRFNAKVGLKITLIVGTM